MTDEEIQTHIWRVAEMAREIDASEIESLVRKGEAGTLRSQLSNYTPEDVRMLAVGVARLRGMVEIVSQNQFNRRRCDQARGSKP